MSTDEAEKKEKKEAMKKLRSARKHWIAEASAKVKAHNKAIKLIRGQLENQAATIPELAQATGMPSAKVLWYMASMKKFGQVLEGDKDGDYFRYSLTDDASEKEAS